MSIASIFVQPQRIRRAKPAAGNVSSLVTDLLRLVMRLVSSSQRIEPLLELVVSSVEESVAATLMGRIESNRETVKRRFERLLGPAADYFREIGARAASGDAEDVERLAEQAFRALSSAVKGMNLDQIRSLCREIAGLIEDDLGITPDFMQELLNELFENLSHRLSSAASEESDREQRENLNELSAIILRFGRLAETGFRFQRFDAEQTARAIYRLVQRSGVADAAGKIECALENISTLSELADGINTTVKGAAMLAGAGDGPGAAACNFSMETRHLWYASWLMKTDYRDIPLFEPDDIKDTSLVEGLKTQANTQSRFLRSRLFRHERELVDQYDSGGLSHDLKTALAAMLNRVIQTENLASHEAFGTVPQGEDAHELLEDRKLALLNRMIIEDRYPDLEKMPRHWYQKIWPWIWEHTFKCKEPVWIDQGADIIYLGDRILHSSEDNVEWTHAPVFGHGDIPDGLRYYCLETIPGDFLEKYTWYSSMILKGLTGTGHLMPWIKGEVPGHYLPSLLNSIYDYLLGTLQAVLKRPLYGYNCLPMHLVDLLLRPLFVTLASMQHRHTEASAKNCFLFWITVFMGDAIRTMSPDFYLSTLPKTVRDVSLSFMTLMNQSGDWDMDWNLLQSDSSNFEKSDDIDFLFFTLFAMIPVNLVKREEYNHPFMPENVPDNVWLQWFLGSTIFGMIGGMSASLFTTFIAGGATGSHFLWNLLKGAGYALGLFWPLMYAMKEGDTDGGRFNPLGGEKFAGYPDKSAAPSPYLLPFEKGRSVFVGQANAGVFSHNPRANGIGTPDAATAQTYAYDFSLDQGVEVLASRPGTVVDFYEEIPDEDTSSWNFIIIRHDLDEDEHGNLTTASPDPVHDKREKGVVTYTYGVYGHGMYKSITKAFGGTTPVKGSTKVRRGQPIMLAGDTGMSFHNHLHMHVLPEKSGTYDDSVAIPFVFQDVEDDGGVCQHLRYYVSDNTKVT